MANSSIILSLKEKVIQALIDDPDIESLIDSSEYSGEELKNTHIFSYGKNPYVITKEITFICVIVDTRLRDYNGTYITPSMTIQIFTHNNHILLPKMFNGQNRNDYLGMLIDEKFNGSSEYGGVGTLVLTSNKEIVATDKFLCRQLTFETLDFNKSSCDRW